MSAAAQRMMSMRGGGGSDSESDSDSDLDADLEKQSMDSAMQNAMAQVKDERSQAVEDTMLSAMRDLRASMTNRRTKPRADKDITSAASISRLTPLARPPPRTRRLSRPTSPRKSPLPSPTRTLSPSRGQSCPQRPVLAPSVSAQQASASSAHIGVAASSDNNNKSHAAGPRKEVATLAKAKEAAVSNAAKESSSKRLTGGTAKANKGSMPTKVNRGEEMLRRHQLGQHINNLHRGFKTVFDVEGTFGPPLADMVVTKAADLLHFAVPLDSLAHCDMVCLVGWLVSLTKAGPDAAPFTPGTPFALAALKTAVSSVGRRELLLQLLPPSTEIRGGLLAAAKASVSDYLNATTLADVSLGQSKLAQPLGTLLLRRAGPPKVQENAMRWGSLTDPQIIDYELTEDFEYDNSAVDTTVALMPVAAARPEILAAVLDYAKEYKFDVAGMRMAFLSAEQWADTSPKPLGPFGERRFEPVLALALRRTNAVQAWQRAVGPDPVLARTTDPNSLRAIHGKDKNDLIVSFSRTKAQANMDVATWFGPRLESGSNKALSSAPGMYLLAPGIVDVCFIIITCDAPLQPLAAVLNEAQEAGFSLQGLARIQLTQARQKAIGMQAGKPPTDSKGSRTPQRAFVVKVVGENCSYHAATIRRSVCTTLGLASDSIITLRSGKVTATLGDIISVPTRDVSERRLSRSVDFSNVSNDEHPQALMITMFGPALRFTGAILSLLLDVNKDSAEDQPLHILGTKWIPQLSTMYAKEVTPIEVGERGYRASVAELTSGPVFFIAVYGIRAKPRFKKIVEVNQHLAKLIKDGSMLPSLTALSSWRQLALFFHEREVLLNHEAYNRWLPPPDLAKGVLHALAKPPTSIMTAAVFSPQCSLKETARMFDRIQREGFEVAALRLATLTKEQADMMQTATGGKGDQYATKPCWVMALRRLNAVQSWSRILDGRVSDKEDIRRDPFCLRSILRETFLGEKLHGSASLANASHELQTLFPSLQGADMAAVDWAHVISACKSEIHYGERKVINKTLSSLVETTCLVVGPRCSRVREQYYSKVFEHVSQKGFRCVGARVVHLSMGQAEQYVSQSARPKALINRMVPGPSLVLALARENAVSCTEMLLCRYVQLSLHPPTPVERCVALLVAMLVWMANKIGLADTCDVDMRCAVPWTLCR